MVPLPFVPPRSRRQHCDGLLTALALSAECAAVVVTLQRMAVDSNTRGALEPAAVVVLQVAHVITGSQGHVSPRCIFFGHFRSSRSPRHRATST